MHGKHIITRPRDSILSLFDPLNSAKKNTSYLESDKENSYPSFDHDCPVDRALFSRTSKHASPVVLKRRLIDIGDVTLDDSFALLKDEELDTDMDNDANNTITPTRIRPAEIEHAISLNTNMRTPFIELSVDRDLTPIARTKMYRRQPAPISSASQSAVVNFSDDPEIVYSTHPTNLAETSLTSPGSTHSSWNRPNLICQIQTPDGEMLVPETDDSPTTSKKTLARNVSFSSASSSPSSESVHLRPNPSQAPSQNYNRHSIDLHSLFHWQLQSEEASFDLLNDKISLFASPNDPGSFLDTLDADDSFEMTPEQAKGQDVASKIRSQQAENDEQSSLESLKPSTTLAVGSEAHPLHPIKAPMIEASSVQKTSHSPTLPRATEVEGSYDATPGHSAARTSDDRAAFPYETLQTPALISRAVVPPPPVPALRIVKRVPRSGHEAPVPAASAPLPIDQSSRPPRSVDPGRAASTIVQMPSTTLPIRSNDGPRRIPIAEHHQADPKKERFVPPAHTTGPRRVVLARTNSPSTASAQVQNKIPLFHDRKVAAQRAEAEILPSSSLPRPATRLPMPSKYGLVRPRPATSVSTGIGSGISRQRDAGKAIPPRRGQ